MNETASNSVLQMGIRAHREGRLEEAELAYRQAMEQNPGDAETLHLLGMVLAQTGDLERGEAWIEKAIAIAPGEPLYRFNHALVLTEMQRMDSAIAQLNAVLALS